ncbi:pulmonary surfactant-associated protein A-like [Rhinoderma darwinii]|uniref:pulmonary surfactant-associated protein A-like n=1 Tax=Rhinoderma darwinii TaxID=43563 RepID=UPI003F6716A5
MLCHGSLLLTVVVGLVSCLPQSFSWAKLPSIADVPKPKLPMIDAEIPNVTGGILDNNWLTGLLRLLGLIKTPIINAKDSLPLFGENDVMGYKPGFPNPGSPDMAASPFQLQDLNRRISRLEAVLKLEGGIQMVGDKMMASNGKEVDFATSKSTCSDVGGQIVTPMNEAENTAVLEFVKKYNRYAYLGMREGPAPGIFNYLNGVPAVYTHWGKGEPSGKGKEGCVEMYTDGRWNDKACNQKRLTVCEL